MVRNPKTDQPTQPTYHFDGMLNDIANYGYRARLAHTHSSCDGLFLDRGIPLRLDDVDSVRSREV